MNEIRPLTGLRGIAACVVVLYHYFQFVAPSGPIRTILVHGYLAVDLFFVLSGFVMAVTYAKTFSGPYDFRIYWNFLYKRLGRIYPLYLLMTLIWFVLPFEGASTSPAVLVSNLLLVQAWGVADSIGGPTWSISTEFAAYLIFPILVAAAVNSCWRAAWGVVLLAIAALVLVATRTDLQVNQLVIGVARNGPLDVFGSDTPYPLLRCLAGFTLGVFAYRLGSVPLCQRLTGARYAGGVALLAVIVLPLLLPDSDSAEIVAFVPLVLCLSREASLTSRVIGSGPIHWLGDISYSIYLIHVLFDTMLRKPLMVGLERVHFAHAFSLSGLLLLLPVIAASAATYYGIEKPARNWARKLARSRPPPITAEPAAP